MNRHASLTCWFAIAASLYTTRAAHAQDADITPETPEASSQATALDRADIETAAVTNGVKVSFRAIEFRRVDELGVDLNFAGLVTCPTVTCLTSAYAREWFNWRNLSVSADVAPVEPERTEPGNARLGIKWAFLDQTSMFRPAAIRALMKAGANELDDMLSDLKTTDAQRDLWKKMQLDTKHFLSNTLHLQNSAIDTMMEEIESWVQSLDCSTSARNIASAFPALESRQTSWETEWDEICRAAKPNATAESNRLDAARKHLSGGLILGIEVALASDAELVEPMDDGDASAVVRDGYLDSTLRASYRRSWEESTIDIAGAVTADLGRKGGDGVSASLSISGTLYRGIHDSSMVLSFEGKARHLDDPDQASLALEGQLTIPVAEQLSFFLTLQEEDVEDSGWDFVPAAGLAWSFEQGGEELLRQIEVAQRRQRGLASAPRMKEGAL